MNEQVEATGMSVKAFAGGNLVIDDEQMTYGFTQVTVDLDGDDLSLKPITYKDNKYQIVKDASTVNQTTGSPDAETKELESASGEGYYEEYIVYIASASESALENQNLTVTVSTTSTEVFSPAITIAFYVGDSKTPVLVNVKNETGTLTSCNIPNIPTSGAAVGLKIVMRVFVDGALANPETGNAYVNSANIPTDFAPIVVNFSTEIE